MTQLSHVDDQGRVRMVDTGNKEITTRHAVASARVLMTSATVSALREHRTPKGDPLEAARLAGEHVDESSSDDDDDDDDDDYQRPVRGRDDDDDDDDDKSPAGE